MPLTINNLVFSICTAISIPLSNEIPSVAYCDLKNDPRKYDGKIIRLKNVKLYWFMHGYFLAHEDCLSEGDRAKAAISRYEPKRESLWNTMEQLSSKR